ncbi:DNA topoisomerase IV subunit A [Balneicella halophila]|uniref:DNA topoisomerase IV subunit A n=1 Tax=Balneicella halophila TaxID=1537566 RepID=A0A7L4UPD0_BALHA|nr:DNA gyrase/topoisomerase IV subunit A [Balneicella halophila]PVX50968.1 DNA topoisomerase IV subunit A [Balneicella halophila]
MSDEIQDLEEKNEGEGQMRALTHLSGMYKEWFLDYASYVILSRAVPYVNDGLKPVQRRILHAMKRLDDGRYNKVANIIGHTMQFHPHGDASIGDALVQLGQKDLLIDTQGNWGNILTGDSAAAPRYIEARLSKFALEVAFNPKTTKWTKSYDGRNEEPIALPMKFPLLLAQGVEGIAVGLASKILPHNFNELLDACISYLKGKEFQLYPDFPSGGMIDVERYNDGLRGGNIKVRAKIEKVDNKTLAIKELPYGKTTDTLIDSILKANDKGKIKIKKIDDNTSDEVEILIHLGPGVSIDQTMDALYAFTDCETSISPNACVIMDDKPQFLPVSDILKRSADDTRDLLKLELEIRKNELQEEWHMLSLERIFIEKRIYRDIEECETWEAVITTIDKGLKPYTKKLLRPVTEEDIIKLTEIRIKKISKYDIDKVGNRIQAIEDEIAEVQTHIENIVPFTIRYFQGIKKKYGAGKERKTEIRSFDNIVATRVVIANEKLYIDRKEGFIGTSLKKDEFLFECSDIDDIIIFRKDGTYMVTKVADKLFIGKDPLYVGLFNKNDDRTIYNVAYRDGRGGTTYVKRFAVSSITRDREYDLTQGKKGSAVTYFTVNPNGEAEVIRVVLKPQQRIKKLSFDYDFSDLAIKNRSAKGNILTKYPVHRITMKEAGTSTLGGLELWYDKQVQRLNTEEHGEYLGEFMAEDKLLLITDDGSYKLETFDITNHFPENLVLIKKYDPAETCSLVFYEGEQEYYYLKRFKFEDIMRYVSLIGEDSNSKLITFSLEKHPQFKITFGGKHKDREAEIINAEEFIGEKSYRARGKRLTTYTVKKIEEIEPIIKDEDLQNTNENNENSSDDKIDEETKAEQGSLF